ncbi:MAG: hypothetical protein L3J46_11245, partial [Kangiellaceae bacterium]|nr:hypothetical protein [Kangiellaceae bacterium]
ENTKIYAGLGLGLDLLFLILYCSTLILACSMVSSSLAIRKSLYFIAGTAIIWGLYTAAICDGIENIALIKLLLGSQSELLPKIAYVFASIKFVLIAFALAFIILGSIQNLMLKGKD